MSNICGVDGCIAEHIIDRARFVCRCNREYVCFGHGNALERGHKFPICETPPWMCSASRRVPCVYPHCDCGMQGG